MTQTFFSLLRKCFQRSTPEIIEQPLQISYNDIISNIASTIWEKFGDDILDCKIYIRKILIGVNVNDKESDITNFINNNYINDKPFKIDTIKIKGYYICLKLKDYKKSIEYHNQIKQNSNMIWNLIRKYILSGQTIIYLKNKPNILYVEENDLVEYINSNYLSCSYIKMINKLDPHTFSYHYEFHVFKNNDADLPSYKE
jgi:hypothetical protein